MDKYDWSNQEISVDKTNDQEDSSEDEDPFSLKL